MDVTLPNGVVIRDVPDGMDKDAIAAKAIKAGLATALDFYGPAPDMSAAEKVLSGIGKSFSETGAGIKQIGAGIGNAIGIVDDSTVSGLQAAEADRRQRDAPLMSTGAGKAGLLGGYVAQSLPFVTGGLAAGASRAGAAGLGGLLARVPALEAAAYGAAQGAMQPTVEGESRAGNAALGGLLGAGGTLVAQGVGKALQAPGRMVDDAMRGRSTSEYVKSVKVLEDAGVPLSSGQKAGANWLKNAETTLADVPWGGKPLQSLQENQRRAYQRKLLQMVGLDDGTDMITQDTLERAANNLSHEYVKALGGKRVAIADDAFLDALGEIEKRNTQFVDDPAKAKVRQIVNGFLEEATKNADVSGEWYQAQRSLFAKRAMKNTEVADLYGDLKTALDDAFRRAAGDAKKGLDAKWAQLSQLKSIFNRTGGPAMSEGFVSPAAVARAASGAPGSKEWQSFTRAAAAVLPDRLGNSGTAQRNMLLGLLGGGGVALDPASIIYGPLLARTAAEGAASGVYPNFSRAVPRFNVPGYVSDQLLAGVGRGIPLGLLAQSQ